MLKLNLLFLTILGLTFAAVPQMKETAPCFHGVDLVWAMDTSRTFGKENFEKAKKYIQNVILGMNVGKGSGQSQVGLFNFDTTDQTVLPLGACADAKCVSDYIGQHDSENNGDHIYFVKAIDYARKEMFTASRPGFTKVLAFVSDGWTLEANSDEGTQAMQDARKRASDDGIETFFFYFGKDKNDKTIEAVVGNDEEFERSFDLETFNDITVFHPCVTSSGTCHNGGVPSCDCKPGFVPPHCHPENVCDKKTVVYDVCHSHGECLYNQVNGSWCNCTHPWTGRWCEIFKRAYNSKRCIKYQTTYTAKNVGNKNVVQNLCDLSKERCIPDNFDCTMNAPTDKTCDANGKCVYTCDKAKDPNTGTKCVCYYPVGWCEPLEDGNGKAKQADLFVALVQKLKA